LHRLYGQDRLIILGSAFDPRGPRLTGLAKRKLLCRRTRLARVLFLARFEAAVFMMAIKHSEIL